MLWSLLYLVDGSLVLQIASEKVFRPPKTIPNTVSEGVAAVGVEEAILENMTVDGAF